MELKIGITNCRRSSCRNTASLKLGSSNLGYTVILTPSGDVMGDLVTAQLTECTKHPILLDKKHHFTLLVVRDCHSRVMGTAVHEKAPI